METLQKFKTFFDEINISNSKNYKLDVLRRYQNDEDIKYYLHYLFSPYTITGISDKKLFKQFSLSAGLLVPGLEHTEIHNFKDCLNYALKERTGSAGVVLILQTYINNHIDKELWPFACGLITKSLNLGVDAKSVNKVIPGLIETFNVMLANKYFEDPERFEGKEFAITCKIDGMRCVAMKDEQGQVSFWSRQGQQIEGLVDLEAEMKEKLPDGIVLDGELVAIVDGPDTYKATMRLARKTTDMEKHDLRMLVFDCMTINEFRNQSCKDWYGARRGNLLSFFTKYNTEHYWNIEKALPVDMYREQRMDWCNLLYDEINKQFNYFSILPILYQGTDTSMITKLLDELTAKGEEGVMINLVDAPYEFKRSWVLAKVKKFQDVDLEIVDYYEGEDSFAGKLGGFIVRYKKGNLVKVGGGYDLAFREEAWENICNDPHCYIGKVAVVKYFEETKNADGGVSLRFPTFKGFREDKGADY